jgi:phage gp45-like
MKTSIIPAVLFAFAATAFAQGGQPDQQVIELKDGGSVVILKDGTTAYYDVAGKRIMMKDGVTMEAKDGSKLMMKNNAIWRQLTEHGTLKPGH